MSLPEENRPEPDQGEAEPWVPLPEHSEAEEPIAGDVTATEPLPNDTAAVAAEAPARDELPTQEYRPWWLGESGTGEAGAADRPGPEPEPEPEPASASLPAQPPQPEPEQPWMPAPSLGLAEPQTLLPDPEPMEWTPQPVQREPEPVAVEVEPEPLVSEPNPIPWTPAPEPSVAEPEPSVAEPEPEPAPWSGGPDRDAEVAEAEAHDDHTLAWGIDDEDAPELQELREVDHTSGRPWWESARDEHLQPPDSLPLESPAAESPLAESPVPESSPAGPSRPDAPVAEALPFEAQPAEPPPPPTPRPPAAGGEKERYRPSWTAAPTPGAVTPVSLPTPAASSRSAALHTAETPPAVDLVPERPHRVRAALALVVLVVLAGGALASAVGLALAILTFALRRIAAG